MKTTLSPVDIAPVSETFSTGETSLTAISVGEIGSSVGGGEDRVVVMLAQADSNKVIMQRTLKRRAFMINPH